MSVPDAKETRPEWPGWTWEEFNRYLTDTLPIFTPVPGQLLQTRQETIDKAWNTPLSVSGSYVELIFSVKEWAGDKAFLAAQRYTDAMARKVAPAHSFEITGSTMPQLIIPNCFQVSIEASSGSQDVTNVIGVRNGAGTAAGAAAAVLAAWKGTGKPLAGLSSLYVMKQVRAMDISSANGAIAIITDTTAGGVVTSNALATNAACALVKWNGGTRSKSSRGRLYYGPLQEQNINADGRTLTAATITNVGASFDAFRASLSSAGYPLVVLSRTLSQSFDVSGSALESVIATQRRRIRS